MRACERLIRYAKVWTTSDEHSGETPSTGRQFDLARMLVSEMKDLGIEDARVQMNTVMYMVRSLPRKDMRTGLPSD